MSAVITGYVIILIIGCVLSARLAYLDDKVKTLKRERDEARTEASRLLDEIEELDPAPVRILPWEDGR